MKRVKLEEQKEEWNTGKMCRLPYTIICSHGSRQISGQLTEYAKVSVENTDI